MKAFQVLHPGILTTIQDFGRKGFMKYGTPASGVADRFAAETANLLAGNDPGAALLEITLFRLELLALTDLVIAVTGGDPDSDDQPGSFAPVAVRDRSNRGSPGLSGKENGVSGLFGGSGRFFRRTVFKQPIRFCPRPDGPTLAGQGDPGDRRTRRPRPAAAGIAAGDGSRLFPKGASGA